MRKIARTITVVLFAILCLGISSIAEEITLTTYYPAPYGAYEELAISQAVSTNNTTSALTISSTDADITVPLVSATTQLRGMLLDSNNATSSYYLLNLRSGATPTSRFYVRNDGRIGIGTTNPVATVDVNGTVNATSYSVDGTSGASGSFTTLDGKTVTVTDGIITSII